MQSAATPALVSILGHTASSPSLSTIFLIDFLIDVLHHAEDGPFNVSLLYVFLDHEMVLGFSDVFLHLLHPQVILSLVPLTRCVPQVGPGVSGGPCLLR